jgi:hydrogenase-4 transcriptional activator
MIDTMHLLRFYLEGIRRWTGAGGASLYVAVPPGLARPLLIHDGGLPPLPELADPEHAALFAGSGGAPAAPVLAAGGGAGWNEISSELPAAVLIPLGFENGGWGASGPRRRSTDAGEPQPELPAASWLGLRFEPGTAERRWLRAELAERRQLWSWLLALGGSLASYAQHVGAVLTDPVSGLHGRAQLQQALAEGMAHARASSRPISLLLLNPDEFGAVNETLGRQAGDRVVLELAGRLRAALRRSDVVGAYGGVMFLAQLPSTDAETALEVAGKLLAHLSAAPYLGGGVRLRLSCGVACFDPGSGEDARLEALGLIWRADQALGAAKGAGGGRAVLWQSGSDVEALSHLDRLTGIFTGDMGRDYRHMVLLWDTVSIIAASPEVHLLAARVLSSVQEAFRLEEVGLFRAGADGELELERWLGGPDGGPADPELAPDAPPWQLVREAWAAGSLLGVHLPAVPSARTRLLHPALAVPLVAGRRTLGCLYLEGRSGSLRLDGAGVHFLRALASQLAMALDRAALDARERKRQEDDRQRLEAELQELREALGQAKLVYDGPEMESVLASARRVAATDVTVLLTGESGTGKELLARTIHRLSRRGDRPLVVVDCSAIAQSLIDSELFGHERGAYTGAIGRSIGRLAEAEGGTVLLDEVGELPLEVQAKLLRFLQERQITSVGATRARQIDVRILAASNRDLALEVEAGRFRADLYYRLNVVPLHLPALRERPSDILPLARHFLERFAREQHKTLGGFTLEAEHAMLADPWPGNVRELQNRVMRAVILSERDRIGPAELGLAAPRTRSRPEAAAPAPAAPAAPARELLDLQGAAPSVAGPAEAASSGPGAGAPEASGDPWAALRGRLAAELDRLEGAGTAGALPLGRWLDEDLMLEADAASSGVQRRGAALLGLPVSTFRRRLRHSRALRSTGQAWRPSSWARVQAELARLVRCAPHPPEGMPERCRLMLLELVQQRFFSDFSTAASLLGVSEPTYRRWSRAGPEIQNSEPS